MSHVASPVKRLWEVAERTALRNIADAPLAPERLGKKIAIGINLATAREWEATKLGGTGGRQEIDVLGV